MYCGKKLEACEKSFAHCIYDMQICHADSGVSDVNDS